jgi:phytoene dehydrogenase-like protein
VSTYDAIVVGGGHNGLVASYYLSASGLHTLVLEQRDAAGGLCSLIEFMPGYRGSITNSPGSLEPKIVLDMQLEQFGLTFCKPDPTVIIPLNGGYTFVGWRDPARVAEQLREISPHDAVAYYETLEFFSRFAERLGISLFQPPPTLAKLVSRLRTPQDEDDFARIFLGSIRDLVDERLETDQVKTLIAQVANFCGNVSPSTPGSPLGMLFRPLSLASSKLSADHDPRRMPLRGSTGLPVGSMGAVGAAMARATAARGTEVRTNQHVERILARDGRACGVVTADGEEIGARLVLSNLNPKTTLLRMLEPGQIDDDLRARLERLKMEGGAFKIAIALDGVPRFAAAPDDLVERYATCQFRIAPSVDYLEAAYDDFKHGRPSSGPKLLGLVPTLTDPSLAPPGRHLLSLNVWYAPYHLHNGAGWDKEKHAFARLCLDRLAEYVPNIKDIIVDYRCFSPVDLEREFGLVEGHQLHGDMTPAHMFSLRPVAGLSDYRTPVSGLYLCGSGAWPGGFVSGIPGHNAAHQVLDDLRNGRVTLNGR